MKISEVLLKYDTDKNKDRHCYGRVYDYLFSFFDRKAPLEIIEIGTEFGESLLAWREFFPNAKITGVDIVDVVKKKRLDIKYLFTDVKDLRPKTPFDIVIDDGSHKLSEVVHVVRNFKLKAGGIMVIEDCQAPGHWYLKIKKHTQYSIECIDLREVNGQPDDYLIVLRNYGYYQ